MASTIAQRARTALGSLGSAAWWTEVLEGAWRQFLQVLPPYLVLIAASGTVTRDTGMAIASAAVMGTIVVVLGRLTGLKPDPSAPAATQFTYRAVSAFAGSLLAFVPVDLGQLLSVDWTAGFLAATASGLLAIVHAVVDAPASQVRHDVVAGEVLSVDGVPARPTGTQLPRGDA